MTASTKLRVALLLVVLGTAGCPGKDGPGELVQLTRTGLPGSAISMAARQGGHYWITLLDGSLWHLAPKAAAWERVDGKSFTSLLGQTGQDGKMYASDAGGVLHRLDGGAWTPTLTGTIGIGVGATVRVLAVGGDGAIYTVTVEPTGGASDFYKFWKLASGAAQWTKLGEGFAPRAGALWVSSEGRFLGWRQNVGVVELDPATAAQTVLVACGHPSLTEGECKNFFRVGVADRAGNVYWHDLADVNGHESALWKLAHGATEPVRVAGPKLPDLPVSVDGVFNAYRAGGETLYADAQNRIWLAFSWGNNDSSDRGYLYRTSSKGWELVRDDLGRGPSLFGDGAPPGARVLDPNGLTQLQAPQP